MDQKTAFKIVEKYLTYLRSNKIDVQMAYIFGSYAKGNFHDDSDIDVALLLKDLSNSFLMQIELMKLSRKIDTRLEPHPFDEKDFIITNPVTNEILKYGIPIS
jgi:uncharacterized protein